MALMAVAGLGWGVYSLAGRGAADPLAATAWNFLLAVPLVLPLAVLGLQAPDAKGIALAAMSGAATGDTGSTPRHAPTVPTCSRGAKPSCCTGPAETRARWT